MLHKILEGILERYGRQTFAAEDRVVWRGLGRYFKAGDLKYLEVGSGLGRFALLVKGKYPGYQIQCLDKSRDLVDYAASQGLPAIQGDASRLNFPDQEFDIVHCSHVIEHLSYEQLAAALDEMCRVLKPGGVLIIRSPLLYPGFYFDLDHIRPYPPEAISNYFNNRQQQRVGGYSVQELFRWYRREARQIYNSTGALAKIFNYLSKLFWSWLSWPRSRPNAYVIFLKRL